MHVSENGLRLIEQFEGFSSAPYWDPYGRVWTRGYGETEGIGPDSPRISRSEGERRLRALLEERYEPSIDALELPLNQNQFDALCSFAWNLGAGIFTGNLRAALEAHNWRQAAHDMLAYDHAGGVVLAGLERRRILEVRLFLRAPDAYVPEDEQRWEHEYDELAHARGAWAAMRRRVLRRVMTQRRRLIWRLAQETGWTVLNRIGRYRELLQRTE